MHDMNASEVEIFPLVNGGSPIARCGAHCDCKWRFASSGKDDFQENLQPKRIISISQI